MLTYVRIWRTRDILIEENPFSNPGAIYAAKFLCTACDKQFSLVHSRYQKILQKARYTDLSAQEPQLRRKKRKLTSSKSSEPLLWENNIIVNTRWRKQQIQRGTTTQLVSQSCNICGNMTIGHLCATSKPDSTSNPAHDKNRRISGYQSHAVLVATCRKETKSFIAPLPLLMRYLNWTLRFLISYWRSCLSGEGQ